MAQIREVILLPKEVPWEGCPPWWLWCAPRTNCPHGAGASGSGGNGPHHQPPSSLAHSPSSITWLLPSPGPEAATPAFQTTQGNRLSCRDQEGRRGSDEVVPGPTVFPSGEPGVSGDFWVRQQVPLPEAKARFGEPLAWISSRRAGPPMFSSNLYSFWRMPDPKVCSMRLGLKGVTILFIIPTVVWPQVK